MYLKQLRVYLLKVLLIIVDELFKKHLLNTKQGIDVKEVRANVRKEDRIIDTLEPVLNQQRLVVDRSVVDWD